MFTSDKVLDQQDAKISLDRTYYPLQNEIHLHQGFPSRYYILQAIAGPIHR